MAAAADSPRDVHPVGPDGPRVVAPRSSHVLAWGVLWLLSYFATRVALERWPDVSDGARIAIALAPILPFLLFLRGFVAGLRELDELKRRIQLEALAIAFPLTMVLLMVLGLVELAIPLSRADWSYRHVWAYLPLFYFGGLALAGRRYR